MVLINAPASLLDKSNGHHPSFSPQTSEKLGKYMEQLQADIGQQEASVCDPEMKSKA